MNYPEAVWEMKKVVPDRRFSIDIALPLLHIAIEVDGWQYHGKYKRDFIRDREKDRALLLAGWRVVRFTAGEIRHDCDRVLRIVESVARLSGR